VLNLERDPRASALVEAGDHRDDLRGVMIAGKVTLHPAYEDVVTLGLELLRRHVPVITDAAVARVERQARKRVCLELVESRRLSWDHRKMSSR